jgi:hypothetical protein
VLILLGVAILAARALPGVSLWMLWPFFVIVPGVVQCFTPGSEGWTVYRFLDGLVTVAVGVILLGNTTGYLSWSVWWQVLSLWPVLLISAGLGILGKAVGQGWLRAAGTVVVLLALGFAAATSGAGTVLMPLGATGGAPFSYTEPLGTTTQAELDLKVGVGQVTMDTGAPSDLVAITGTSPWGSPTFVATRSGSAVTMSFELPGSQGIAVYPGSVSARTDVALSEASAWDVTVDSGVSSLDADLSGVPVGNLLLKTGVSTNRIRLGRVPQGATQAQMRVESGVASVDITIPRDAEARIVWESGLTGHTISSDFVSVDGGWQTSGYEDAKNAGAGVWLITVKTGLGSFSADTY